MYVGERWELEQDDGTFTLESPTLRQTQEVIKTNEETITPTQMAPTPDSGHPRGGEQGEYNSSAEF